jgi:hypothetical protein
MGKTEPAYPTTEYNVNGGHYEGRYEIHAQYPGMNLRDYFAASVLNGLLSDQRDGSAWSTWNREEMAAEAYRRADAMLAAREAP